MRAKIEAGIATQTDPRLARELLDAFEEAKRNFHLGGLRLSAVEGGRFCEAAFRILEQVAHGSFTPIGQHVDTDSAIRRLAGVPSAMLNDSIRLHIPRGLRVIYDIRNKRDAAHLADGIDPNLQDATLIVSMLSWVLAEFVRLFHNVRPEQAQEIVEALVARSVPVLQDFDGTPRVLNPSLGASDHVLVLLYHRAASGATFEQLRVWVRPPMRANLRRTLNQLDTTKDFVHCSANVFKITRLGERYVEIHGLLDPPTDR